MWTAILPLQVIFSPSQEMQIYFTKFSSLNVNTVRVLGMNLLVHLCEACFLFHVNYNCVLDVDYEKENDKVNN